ncbi:MAG: hypothetical protein ACK5C4_15670, partial [Pseudanabaena sp.]
SPACSPKPRGKSLGWKSGRKRAPFPRFPIIKKRASRPKKVNKDILNWHCCTNKPIPTRVSAVGI